MSGRFGSLLLALTAAHVGAACDCGGGGGDGADAAADADAAPAGSDARSDSGAVTLDGGPDASRDGDARGCLEIGQDLRDWLAASSDCTASGACTIASTGGVGPPSLAGACECALPVDVGANTARLSVLADEWTAAGCGAAAGCDLCVPPPPTCAPDPSGGSTCTF